MHVFVPKRVRFRIWESADTGIEMYSNSEKLLIFYRIFRGFGPPDIPALVSAHVQPKLLHMVTVLVKGVHNMVWLSGSSSGRHTFAVLTAV